MLAMTAIPRVELSHRCKTRRHHQCVRVWYCMDGRLSSAINLQPVVDEDHHSDFLTLSAILRVHHMMSRCCLFANDTLFAVDKARTTVGCSCCLINKLCCVFCIVLILLKKEEDPPFHRIPAVHHGLSPHPPKPQLPTTQPTNDILHSFVIEIASFIPVHLHCLFRFPSCKQ